MISLITFFTIISCLIMAGVVILRKPDHPAHHAMSLLSVCFALWAAGTWMALLPNGGLDFFWVKTVMFVTIPIPGLFLYFSLHFVKLETAWTSRLKKLQPLIFILTVILMYLSFTPLMFSEYAVVNHHPQLTPGPAAIAYGITFSLLSVCGISVLITGYRRSTGLTKLQLAYVLFGLALTVVVGFNTNFILVALFQRFDFVAVGPLSSLFFLSCVTYAMVRHRLLDLRMVILRGLISALTVVIIAGGMTALWALGMQTFALHWFQDMIEWHIFLLVAFTAVVFPQLLNWVQSGVEHILAKHYFHPETAQQQLSQITAEVFESRELVERLKYFFSQTFHLLRCKIVLINQRKTKELCQNLHDCWSSLSFPEIIVFDELEESEWKEFLRTKDIMVMIPLQLRKEQLGWILLGSKHSGNAFSLSEIQFCQMIQPQVSLAFFHAQTRRKARQFTRLLQQEVDGATKELKRANTQLNQLDKLKDEFVSIASHELRTPMTAIRSYLWLSLFRTKETLPPTVKNHLTIAYSATERLLILVKELLTVSQLEAGRLELQRQPVDVAELVTTTLRELEVHAQEKHISVAVKYDTSFKEHTHLFWLDHMKITEVLQNLLGNALKFSPLKSKILLKISVKNTVLTIAVRDHGPGMSKEQKEVLFQKFGMKQHASGLGLFIAQKFAQLHGGRISVRSEVGKGSVFMLRLPEYIQKDVTR